MPVDWSSERPSLSASRYGSVIAARRVRDMKAQALYDPPLPARGLFPYPHLTVEEVDKCLN
jgi:hypothetical protein